MLQNEVATRDARDLIPSSLEGSNHTLESNVAETAAAGH
jgi:hypothetical protein